MLSCSNCATDAPPEAKFCGHCGSELQPAPDSEATGERRQVTVTFCDLSGFTAMTESLPAEDVRQIMRRVFTAAGEACDREGGYIHQLLGDGVMAFFGLDAAHEDDAERAIRFAMALHREVESISETVSPLIGRDLMMHSGINTGVVVTGGLTIGSAVAGPLGDTVNVAARLESLAAPGEILIGQETKALVERSFETIDRGQHELQGKERAQQVWQVTGNAAVGHAPSRLRSDFVGRHEELGVLRSALDRLLDGEGTAITVCAEAGSGKSRLLEEFRLLLDDEVTWIEGRATPSSQSQPYAVVIDLLRRAAGIEEGASVEKTRRRLRDMASGLSLDPDDVATPLGRLFNSGEEEDLGDREAFGERLRASLTALIQALAERDSTVVCLQDLHWSDPSSVALIRSFIDDITVPALFICNFRPGFELGVPDERAITLRPLTRRQISELIRSVLDSGEPPAELIDFVLERSDGNPFFAEEMINRLIETRTIIHNGVEWTIERPLAEASVPGTIRGLIGSRIDALEPARRRVLRQAAVVGRNFLYELVDSIADEGDALVQILDGLEDGDFIRRVDAQLDLEYIFKHALTQEVAYAGLLREERELLHVHVAETIEDKLSDRLDEFAETLAHHYLRSSVPRRAVPYLRIAAKKAVSQYALDEAEEFYRQAYDLLRDGESGPAEDRALAELLTDWSLVHYYHAEFGQVKDLLERHAEVRERLEDDALAALWDAWDGHQDYLTGPSRAASTTLLESAAERAERANDPTTQAHALSWLIWPLWQTGQTHAAVAIWPQLEKSIDRIDDDQARRYPFIKGISGMGIAKALLGDFPGTIEAASRLRALARSTGNARAESLSHNLLHLTALLNGDNERAIREAEVSGETARDIMYVLVAKAWLIAGYFADQRTDELLTLSAELRQLCGDRGIDSWHRVADLGTGVGQLLSGSATVGMRALESTRTDSVESDDTFMTVMCDIAIATTLARVATGEAETQIGTAIRNPGFAFRHARGASKRAHHQLVALSESLGDRSLDGLRFLVDYELAKLAVHRRDWAEAEGAVERARGILHPEFGTAGDAKLDAVLASFADQK